ncbi:cellulase family glycosylhydrolase [Candidatus Uhrbacteria bacterium]|nr:cellulase family glycosylhydrolase [Candidatus Uhrbacteria bacterium]
MHHHHSKSFYALASLATIATLAVFTSAFVWLNTRSVPDPTFGVTFSWVYALQLGEDPVQTYQALVDDLDVRHVRLPLYWSEIERAPGEYNWSVPDQLVSLSEDRGVEVTLVVGMKVPRWPECYIPDWAEKFNGDYQHQAALDYIEQAVNHYKDSASIVRWQVENEPFFPFGECPTITGAQFKERVDLVRSLDDRPIQVTVSGELGPWLDSAQAADVLGISLYRQTWNDLFGYFVYPLTPEYYFFRAQLVEDYVSKVIVSELQAEPWFPEPIESRPIQEWYDSFDAQMFQDNVAFAREAGLSEAYLWGAEWWYALKTAGDDRLWETARSLFKPN